MKKRLTLLLSQFWRPLLIGLALAVITCLMLFWHLGSWPPALSAPEVATRQASSNLHFILHHPINSPLTIPEHFFMMVRPHGIAASRAVPAIYGIVTLVLLFVSLRFWQGTFTALIGTAMFGTSSWFLHTSRLDTSNVLLFGLVALIAVMLWLKHTLRRNLLTLICAVAIGAALYIPGMIWFIAIGGIWYYRAVLHELKHTKKLIKVLSVIVLAIMALPLAWALVRQPSIALTAAGLPSHFSSLLRIGRNLLNIPVHLFIHGPLDPVRWLGHMPILDVFTDAMLVLGVYTFWQHRKLYRSKLLFGAAVVSVILIAIGGAVNITILMPLIYIAVSAGVLYMLDAWRSVFPRNPVARGFGAAALLAAVVISCSFQLNSYFVAWQHAPATKAVFTHPATNVISPTKQ